MKTKITSTFGMLATVAAITVGSMSCSDKKDTPAPEETKLPAPSAAEFAKLRANVLDGLTVSKNFKAEDGIRFTTDKGTNVEISPNCLRKPNGDPATGEVKLSFIEIYDQSDMVLANKPLMGRNADGKLEPLVTAGQFFIEVKQGSETLAPGCGYRVIIPASLTGGADNDMILWKGSIDDDGNLAWDEIEAGREEGVVEVGKMETPDGQGGQDEVYDVYYSWVNTSQFGWINLDRFYHYQGEKTVLNVHVPDGYNSTNTNVYIIVEDEPNMLTQLYSYPKGSPFSSGGFVPVGKNVHVIFVSESNGEFVHAIKTVNIKADEAVTFEHKDLATISNEALVTKIKTLK